MSFKVWSALKFLADMTWLSLSKLSRIRYARLEFNLFACVKRVTKSLLMKSIFFVRDSLYIFDSIVYLIIQTIDLV